MKNKLLANCYLASLVLSLILSSPLSCWDASLDADIGYRHDTLDWSIAGFNQNPNILSELSWRNLDIVQVGMQYLLAFHPQIYSRSRVTGGLSFNGRNRDSDYHGNNRTLEYSRTYCNANNSVFFDATTGVGWVYPLYCSGPCSFFIAPVLGVSYHWQKLHMRDGVQVVDTISNRLGPIVGLRSHYRAQWFGPWVGADAIAHFGCLYMRGSYEMHFADYQGLGCWNLRTDFFDDFRHIANAQGQQVTLEAKYPICTRIYFGVMGDFRRWHTSSGRDTVFINVVQDDGSITPVKATTHLNAVHWHSFALSAFVSAVF